MTSWPITLLLTLAFPVVQFAGSITVGVPTTSGNHFPFLGTGTAAVGSRLQQAYGSVSFPETILITDISFFRQSEGVFRSGTYDLYLSTISGGIDTLSHTNFNGNLGADDTFFARLILSGSLPAVLTFSGGPFLYNPANGNLLLDIIVSNAGADGYGGGFQWQFGASGVFSRYYDFFNPPVSAPGSGLVTQFDYNTPVPEPGTLSLIGLSAMFCVVKMRLRALRSVRED